MQNNPEREVLDFSPFILLFWKKRFLFIVVFIVAGLASFGVSMFLKPVYESFAVIFPAQGSSIEKQLDGLEFGLDIHAERLIQVLESESIRDSISREFHLVQHYELDSTQKGWEDKFKEIFYGNFDFLKSKYKSLVIEVRDHDPVLAANMANETVRLLNVVNSQILISNGKEMFATIKNSLDASLKRVAAITDSLSILENSERAQFAAAYLKEQLNKEILIRGLNDSIELLNTKFGISNISIQSDEIERHLQDARANFLIDSGRLSVLERNPKSSDSTLIRIEASKEGSRQTLQYFEKKAKEIAVIKKKYSTAQFQLETENNLLLQNKEAYDLLLFSPSNEEVVSHKLDRLMDNYKWELAQLNIAKQQYQKASLNYLQPTPASFSVSKAVPSYKKVSPVIWMNVTLTILFSMFATAVFLVVSEKISKIKNQAGG